MRIPADTHAMLQYIDLHLFLSISAEEKELHKRGNEQRSMATADEWKRLLFQPFQGEAEQKRVYKLEPYLTEKISWS